MTIVSATTHQRLAADEISRRHLNRLGDIEDQTSALRAQRDQVLAKMITELEWMDIAVIRERAHSMDRESRPVPVGAEVHVVRQDHDVRGLMWHLFHLAEDCPGHWCVHPGKPRRARGVRRGNGFDFTFLGIWYVAGNDGENVVLIPTSRSTVA